MQMLSEWIANLIGLIHIWLQICLLTTSCLLGWLRIWHDNISKQLEFRFYPAGDMRDSGGGTTLNGGMLLMQLDEGPHSELDRKMHLGFLAKYVPMHTFQTFYTNTSSWTASTNIKSFKHLSAGLIFFIVSNLDTVAPVLTGDISTSMEVEQVRTDRFAWRREQSQLGGTITEST